MFDYLQGPIWTSDIETEDPLTGIDIIDDKLNENNIMTNNIVNITSGNPNSIKNDALDNVEPSKNSEINNNIFNSLRVNNIDTNTEIDVNSVNTNVLNNNDEFKIDSSLNSTNDNKDLWKDSYDNNISSVDINNNELTDNTKRTSTYTDELINLINQDKDIN